VCAREALYRLRISAIRLGGCCWESGTVSWRVKLGWKSSLTARDGALGGSESALVSRERHRGELKHTLPYRAF
jgi:hypothetical protein